MLFFATLAACPSYGRAQDLDKLLESARAAQSTGNYADAAKFYSRATSLAPGSPELWANRGMVEYLADQFDASAASLNHALKLNPGLFAPLLFLGKTYIQTGKPAQALPYLNRAHSLKPDDVEVLVTLAKSNADLSRQRQAASFYADAARIAPENTTAWYGLGVSSLEVINSDGRALAASQAQSIWTRALYADELFAQGRPVEAMATYKASLAEASPTQKATLARTIAWTHSHPDLFPLPSNSQEALQRLDGELKAEEGNAMMVPCVGEEKQHQPRLKAASGVDSLLQSAACSYWAGDYERSAAEAGEALRESGQNPEALYWSVKANERIAVSALSRFEELAPQSAKVFVMVGDLYRFQRQMDSALAEYKKALSIDAHDASALMGAAVASLNAGKLDEAEALDKDALADRPLDPELNLLMADILAAKNQYGDAKAYLAKCLDAPPELQSRVHRLLGRTEMEDGNTEEAIRQFELALPGDEDGSLHYQLSRLYRKTGRLTEAQKAEADAKVLIKRRDANAVIAVREATSTNP